MKIRSHMIVARNSNGQIVRVDVETYDPATAQRLADLQKRREEAESLLRELDQHEQLIVDAFRAQYAADN